MTEGAPRVERNTHESHVDYMGVKLPMAQDKANAPKIENFNDYVEDAFSRSMERTIATAWALGEPILIEGGTSLGKTRAVKKMCAELGYEVHYQNLNNHTDPADLMGKYTPNPDQLTESDPKYIFADGSVTKALRAEPGKVKVLILDEYNSAHPGVIIRLHEVLDAYKTGGTVTLTEDGNEQLQIERDGLKIIAITNPASGGFADREPLDPAQIRRWTYHKLPDELPKETFKAGVLALAGLAGTKTTPDTQRERRTESRPDSMPAEMLAQLPGMAEIVPQYVAFHEAAKNMVKAKRIALNQRQKFTFDDREEPRRVFAYIARFYDGDIGAVMRDALRYFYAGKVLNETDKASLEEMILKVDFKPPRNTERRSLDALASDQPESPTLAPDVAAARSAFTDQLRTVLRMGIPVIGPKDFAEQYSARFGDLNKEQITEALKKIPLVAIPYTPRELREIQREGKEIRFRTRLDDITFRARARTGDLRPDDFYWSVEW